VRVDVCLKGFEFLRDAGELQVQPVLKHRHAIFTPTSLPKPMAEADLVGFFNVIDSARDRLLFLLMLRCGLRVSEVCALTWKDVDLPGGTLLILNGKGQVDRVAYLAPDAEQALQLWKEAQKPANAYFFPGQKPRQTPLTTRTVNWMMREYLRQAGIEKPYTPHCLRHAFATELINAGVRLEVLKELMGHRSLHMSLRYRARRSFPSKSSLDLRRSRRASVTHACRNVKQTYLETIKKVIAKTKV
jgi:integrase/recombinase XerD